MALLYSRPRIKLPKLYLFHHKDSFKKHKMRGIVGIIGLFLMVFYILIKAIAPIFNQLCLEKAKNIATMITNEETTNAIKNYQYSDFVLIHKDDKGNIMMLESNMKNMNQVISDVAINIQKHINQTKDEYVYMSIGSFTGVSLLSGKGYKVPIEIATIGNVKTNVKSEFISQGINQTLHRLYLEIECEISILTPFHTTNEWISNQFILAENVIVGNIPDTYYNLEGITTGDAMQMMQ